MLRHHFESGNTTQYKKKTLLVSGYESLFDFATFAVVGEKREIDLFLPMRLHFYWDPFVVCSNTDSDSTLGASSNLFVI